MLIRLAHENGREVLEVRDDGAGMRRDAARSYGMGLRIMRHRASLIGATLELRPAEGGGLVVRCVGLESR
ncbi:MAG TPA: hypothetical protein VM716_02530 [Gemmatimonadales bacterium]|nr:hypothetical protein [Gemmatimonadales bacterium]